MARNRIIYASQSVWCNGEVLYRVQSLGSTTTFTSEDIFELGHLDIVDVVDDVPAVAVTLNTNDFGDVRTLAILAQVPADKIEMDATATNDNANLAVVDSSGVETGDYYHGVGLPDFAITCGNLTGVSLWAPVQDECSLGTLADEIDQTMWMDEVYVNSLELSYTTGANATENYGAETDQKMWLLNDGKFVSFQAFTLTSGTQPFVNPVASGVQIVNLSDGNDAWLRKDAEGLPAVTWFDLTNNEAMNIAIVNGTSAAADTFIYHAAMNRVYLPTATGIIFNALDRIEMIYAGDAYDTSVPNKYFEILDDVDRPDTIGALRQGQVEVYLVDPSNPPASWADAIGWRFTSATITADLTREALLELGHLGPYDRPLTLPIPITVTMDTTAGDLEHWARFAGVYDTFESGELDEIDLADLFGNDDMILVVKIYAQTDEEAGGTGVGRSIIGADNELIGQNYFNAGVVGTYAANNTERPLKTVIVEHLKITDEAYTLDVGANATQTFGFRSTNDLYVVKGEVDLADITTNKIRRNG